MLRKIFFKMKSHVWNFTTKIENENGNSKAICNICRKEYSLGSSGSTGGISAHLDSVHGITPNNWKNHSNFYLPKF